MNPFPLPSPLLDPTSPILISIPVVLFVFKGLFLITFALYIIYALVIVRQISLMSRTIHTSLEWFVKILGLVHLAAAILIWVIAFMA
ncbi:hypothetical protein C5B42_01905 [Candidatus Cerribacteria bacterium 'Amazon FNV 2010 28 9']|uniref:Uncharacterized protein n=1 Tax=Candidatus Cerribacteria bacterium 'Amazon FNV 2010 28 9' TaxID=2081795 RepID=A0A317JPT3_9BACT|nr:MAG: hypothetical protein C5B42_01905 [Candidatus Cerribacteria bacterium 'Amazon FNV 2010 28 9']